MITTKFQTNRRRKNQTANRGFLPLLAYDGFQISEAHKIKNISDHGQGWGNSMDWNLLGEYLPEIKIE